MSNSWYTHRHAWALEFIESDRLSQFLNGRLAGVYTFGGEVEDRLDGCRTALFRTREKAREAAKRHSGRYTRFRIRKVNIKLEAIDGV
jgi:hypothetical protein